MVCIRVHKTELFHRPQYTKGKPPMRRAIIALSAAAAAVALSITSCTTTTATAATGISKVRFGANVGSLANWSKDNTEIGPLHAVRVFYSGQLPNTYADMHIPDGVAAWVSYKQHSSHDAAFAKSCPPWTRVIYHHEPENDYGPNGAQFVKEYVAEYDEFKAANPIIRFGMAAMTYQYAGGRNGQSGTYLPPANKVDFYAADNYEAKPTGKGLATDTEFQNWYNLVKDRGKPVSFAEYGVGVNPIGYTVDKWSALRAQTFKADTVWMQNHSIASLLYWYNTGSQGDWKFHDAASLGAWHQMMSTVGCGC